MIFILAMEVLTPMFFKAQADDFINGFKASPNGDVFSILQFADDTFILVDGESKEVKAVKNYLVWFEVVFGLKVNTDKSVLYQVNTIQDWGLIVDLWKYKKGTFRDVYLGLPLGAK